MGMFSRLGSDLYTGRKSVDFVGRKWLWYAMSGVIVLVALAGLQFRGLEYGIEFTGGSQFKVSDLDGGATQENADLLREEIAAADVEGAASPQVTTSGENGLLVQVAELNADEAAEVAAVITSTLGVQPDQLSQEKIGASWGQEIRNRALLGLVVFLFLVVLFIWAYFRQWKMSAAALVALAHDVVITVGVYALSGFEVTPATVTGVLTILGFSLYDTVVVFDKVRENTKNLRQTRMSYAAAANLALNQTLVRSINTSLVALIPVGAILYVGAVQLGASSLKDLALALFVGMAAGTYSSVFIATPLLVHLKSRESEVVLAERRAKARERRSVDKYAAVPSFADDMPIYDEDGALLPPTDALDDVEDGPDDPDSRPTGQPRQAEAIGRGRTAPVVARPVDDGSAARRPQPSRQPRSKRTKK
jgi:preprotein translocase subunit SecF